MAQPVGAFRIVWEGDSESDCVDVCRELKDAGIEYKVSQFPTSRYIKMEVNWRYEIGVPTSYYQRAKGVLGINARSTGKGDQEDEAALELPAANDSTINQGDRSVSYLKRWRPEDASAEVWTQGPADTSSVVELSLKVNLIHFRSEFQKDGTRKFFVLPEDESRAREIVREIKEGTPPE